MFPRMHMFHGTALSQIALGAAYDNEWAQEACDKAKDALSLLKEPMNKRKVLEMTCFNLKDEDIHRKAFQEKLSTEQMTRVFFIRYF